MLFRSDDCEYRRRAVVALGKLGDPRAIPDVRRLAGLSWFARTCFNGEIERALRALREAEKAATAGGDPAGFKPPAPPAEPGSPP